MSFDFLEQGLIEVNEVNHQSLKVLYDGCMVLLLSLLRHVARTFDQFLSGLNFVENIVDCFSDDIVRVEDSAVHWNQPLLVFGTTFLVSSPLILSKSNVSGSRIVRLSRENPRSTQVRQTNWTGYTCHIQVVSLRVEDGQLGDLTFDETYNLREAVDFLSDKLAVREKLIQSARQFSEKSGNAKFGVTVKRFEDLMADFLRLYSPLLERVAGHRDMLQKDITAQKDALTGVLGMIQVARGVDVLTDRVKELESEAKGIESTISDKVKAIEKIEELLGKARRQGGEPTRQLREEPAEVSESNDDYMFGIREQETKMPARKSSSR